MLKKNNLWSFRVDGTYRIVFYFEGDSATFLYIGHHKELLRPAEDYFAVKVFLVESKTHSVFIVFPTVLSYAEVSKLS